MALINQIINVHISQFTNSWSAVLLITKTCQDKSYFIYKDTMENYMTLYNVCIKGMCRIRKFVRRGQILTHVDSDELVQPPLKLRASK